jgi:hypothetical protein
MVEFWKQFRNTQYFISPLGQVKNMNSGLILKQQLHYRGHLKICLTIKMGNFKNKQSKKFFVHRLVAECWLKKIKGKNVVNYKDTIKTNNYISNLEYCTQKENVQHAYDNGLIDLEYARSCKSKKIC